jgi:hypothetical protein
MRVLENAANVRLNELHGRLGSTYLSRAGIAGFSHPTHFEARLTGRHL